MLNIKHLFYYNVFANELSTTKAAKRLRISSSALSNQLKELENFLNMKLTKRIGGKVVITETGEMVLSYTNQMFEAYEQLKNQLQSAQNIKNTHFRIGICQYMGAQFSFDLLSLMVKSPLSISKQVHVAFHNSEKLLSAFREDEYDFILGAFESPQAAEKSCVSQLLSFPVRLFAPSGFVEASKINEKEFQHMELSKIIELANEKKISLALPMRPSILRQETELLLSKSNIQPLRTIESNSSSAIVQLIERGFAMAFVPTPCLLDFKSAATLTVLGPNAGYWNHGLSVLVQKDTAISTSKLSPLAEMFSSNSKFV